MEGAWAKQACHFKDFLFILIKHQEFMKDLSDLHTLRQN